MSSEPVQSFPKEPIATFRAIHHIRNSINRMVSVLTLSINLLGPKKYNQWAAIRF